VPSFLPTFPAVYEESLVGAAADDAPEPELVLEAKTDLAPVVEMPPVPALPPALLADRTPAIAEARFVELRTRAGGTIARTARGAQQAAAQRARAPDARGAPPQPKPAAVATLPPKSAVPPAAPQHKREAKLGIPAIATARAPSPLSPKGPTRPVAPKAAAATPPAAAKAAKLSKPSTLSKPAGSPAVAANGAPKAAGAPVKKPAAAGAPVKKPAAAPAITMPTTPATSAAVTVHPPPTAAGGVSKTPVDGTLGATVAVVPKKVATKRKGTPVKTPPKAKKAALATGVAAPLSPATAGAKEPKTRTPKSKPKTAARVLGESARATPEVPTSFGLLSANLHPPPHLSPLPSPQSSLLHQIRHINLCASSLSKAAATANSRDVAAAAAAAADAQAEHQNDANSTTTGGRQSTAAQAAGQPGCH